MDSNIVENVLNLIDSDELTGLVRQLVDIPSPPGEENEVSEFIFKWLKENGLGAIRQEVEPGRLNAVGVLPGTGKGLNLMFNGHLDTSHPGTDEDLATFGEEAASLRPKSFLKDGAIYGLGSYNCKGPVATALIALKALKEGGLIPNGDVTVAAVCGEIGRAPIGQYQGPAYHGHGYGTRYLLTHGISPDMALVVEPSFHHLVWTLPGVLYAKVTAFGESMYMPFINRAKREKEGTNCITNMVKMLEAIEEWASEYEERNKYESPGGTVTAKVNIGAIEGGQSYAPNFSMFSCRAYVDIRILPTRDLNDVKREFKQVLEKTSIDFRMEFYRSHKGYEGRNTQPLADGIRAAYRQVFNAEPPQDGSGANMWNDVNIFHEMGIPAVKFGIGSVAPMTLSLNKAGSEGVKIDEYVNMAKIYALTAINICSFDG